METSQQGWICGQSLRLPNRSLKQVVSKGGTSRSHTGARGKEFVLCPEGGKETLKKTLHLSSQSQGTSPLIEIPIH